MTNWDVMEQTISRRMNNLLGFQFLYFFQWDKFWLVFGDLVMMSVYYVQTLWRCNNQNISFWTHCFGFSAQTISRIRLWRQSSVNWSGHCTKNWMPLKKRLHKYLSTFEYMQTELYKIENLQIFNFVSCDYVYMRNDFP